MANYDVGDKVRISAVFTDISGVAADPTTVTVKVKNPAKVTTTYSAVKDSVGHYHYDLLLDAAGLWWVRWEGTGALVAAEEEKVEVNRSQFS